jgi:uncharacterized protein with HEPN domain
VSGHAQEQPLESAYGARTVHALRDFREFAAQGVRLVARGRAAYDEDEMLRLASDAIIVKLGETVVRMSDDFVAEHPELPLRVIKDMRNLVTHQYDVIGPQLVWNALQRELPAVDHAAGRLLDRG